MRYWRKMRRRRRSHCCIICVSFDLHYRKKSEWRWVTNDITTNNQSHILPVLARSAISGQRDTVLRLLPSLTQASAAEMSLIFRWLGRPMSRIRKPELVRVEPPSIKFRIAPIIYGYIVDLTCASKVYRDPLFVTLIIAKRLACEHSIYIPVCCVLQVKLS